jgi:hypothetical protein
MTPRKRSSYYTSGYPRAMRDAYLKKWHQEHDPKPGKEPTVFGHNAALACHMANESYFRKSAVTWDASSNQIKS